MNSAAYPWFPSFEKLTGLVGLGVMCAAAGPVARAADPAPPEAKPYMLFMGADIDVQQGKKSYRVANVSRDAFVIVVDGKPQEVPANRGKINLNAYPQLKLSPRTAVVTELKFERAYTPENDPVQKWKAVMAATTAGSNAAAEKQMAASLSAQRGAALSGPNATAMNNGAAAATFNVIGPAEPVANSQNSAGYAAGRMQEDLDQKLFDAVKVTCEVSAARPMRDPYLVVIAQFREKDDPPGSVKNWIYAQQMDRLDENPVRVRIMRGGFPPGFEIVKQQIHIYGAGQELGTNVADKNVALTRDEAHQYIVIDHLATHKGATLAPAVALGISFKDFFPHFASVQLQQPVFIKVDKDGRPRGAFRDEKCTEATDDAYLDSLAAQVRFKPALQAGQAVASVAKLKIADLAL